MNVVDSQPGSGAPPSTVSISCCFHAGDSAAYKLSASVDCSVTTLSSSLQWQPCSAAADSHWLIVGRYGLNCRTSAVTTLATGREVEWALWCEDGIHAVLLHRSKDLHLERQVKVCHVASGMLTGCLKCVSIPAFLHVACSQDLHVSCNAQFVLVPATLQTVSLCRLPSLDRVAQLVGPELAGQPATLLGMGWAAHDSLIALAWQAADETIQVTVHSGSDGNLHHTLRLKPQEPLIPKHNYDELFRAFTACPDLPRAAAAWRSGTEDIYVALIDLASGTQTLIKRPPTAYLWGERYAEARYQEMEFAWAPGGQHLMVHETTDAGGQGQDWAIFDTSSGEWCGPPRGTHFYDEPPVWSSQGTFCLVGDESCAAGCNVLDFSVHPPVVCTYFSDAPNDHPTLFHSGAHTFVPATQDLVQHESQAGARTPMKHWMYNAQSRSSSCHQVPGVSGRLGSAYMNLSRTAWHSTLRAARIYALSESKRDAAVHLIDAKRHCRLFTWTARELAGICPHRIRDRDLKYDYLVKWSPDGKDLALVNSFGTIIFSFGPEHAAQHLLQGDNKSFCSPRF